MITERVTFGNAVPGRALCRAMATPRRPIRGMHTPRYRRFVKRLILAREKAAMTQKQAADALGQREPWVSKCEAGQRRVDVIELLDFARVYRVPLAFFLK